MADARVLLVEDDLTIAEAVALNLREEGLRVTVARRGDEGLQLANTEKFALVVLDLMLPGVSGQDICREVRERQRVPILMLTARAREMDRVVGLELGADDYLTKPFGMLELIARVKAWLRRAALPAETEEETYSVDGVTLDVPRRRGQRGGETITIRPKQFDLLRVLLANPGRVMLRDRLLQLVWGTYEYMDSGTLDVHIRWLRHQLEPDPSRPQRILTVRGVAYQYAEHAP